MCRLTNDTCQEELFWSSKKRRIECFDDVEVCLHGEKKEISELSSLSSAGGHPDTFPHSISTILSIGD